MGAPAASDRFVSIKLIFLGSQTTEPAINTLLCFYCALQKKPLDRQINKSILVCHTADNAGHTDTIPFGLEVKGFPKRCFAIVQQNHHSSI